MEVSLPDLSAVADAPVVVTLSEARCIPPVIERLREVISTHPGITELHLRVTRPGGRVTVLRAGEALRVERSPSLYGDLKALLGPGCLQSATPVPV